MEHAQKYATVMTLTWATKPLLYSVPDNLLEILQPGMLVEIPFGKKMEYGIIDEIMDSSICDTKFQIKNISKLLYPHVLLGHDILQLIKWISDYYLTSLKNVAESVIPSVIRKLMNPKISTTLEIKQILSENELFQLKKCSPKQYEIYQNILSATSPINKNTIKSKSALNALINKNIVIENFVQIQRIEYYDRFGNNNITKKNIIFNNDQQIAANDIIDSINKKIFCTHLLHGITGSGKTEVYIAAINHVLEQNGDVIMLVPELALTPQTVNRIRNGISKYNDNVLVWHSGLSEGERRDAWLALSNGEAKIVIGARSAIFAPLKNIQLIIVDEEHESSYKQSDGAHYHARDVAVYRAKLNQAVCILGSATPSLESAYNAQNKKYKLNILSNRINNCMLPIIELVNMQQENRKNILSHQLETMINDRLNKHEQTILFLNRRGYATIVLCKNCNYYAQCSRCNVSLTYHHDQRKMLCHLCGHEEPLPIRCPTCGSNDILQCGIGSQKLEQVVAKIFPAANIVRIDSDIITKKYEMRQILNRFQNNEIDIMIGTQMIAKGLDFPNVSLVGIIDIDGIINFPDFRSPERAFQLITQVAGRAGRGDKPGHVLVQTYNPQSYIIQLAKQHKFEQFIKTELENRKEFLYPPWRRIIKFGLASKDETSVKNCAQNLYQYLKNALPNIEIKNATPAILSKINNKYRYTIVTFSKKSSQDILDIKNALLTFKKPTNIDITVDVDPIDLT